MIGYVIVAKPDGETVRVIGKRRGRDISEQARGDLLREGAQFSTEMLKIQRTFRFPMGLFRYRTHEEAERHWMEGVVAGIVALHESRHAR